MLALASVTFGVGCSQQRLETPTQRAAAVQSIGEGIYVFSSNNFPLALKEFKEVNRDKRIVSVTQGSDTKYGLADTNYAMSESFIVITEAR